MDTHNISVLSPFLEKLAATEEGDHSLLDSSLIVYGGGMGNGNLHRHSDIPCLTFGSLAGRIPTGQHLAYPMDTPMCNLLVTMLNHTGVEIERFGDSSGALDLGSA